MGKTKISTKDSRAKYVLRNKMYKLEYLLSHPCIDCGYSDPRALEFDHVKGKKKDNVSTLCMKARSLDLIKEEIAKCEVRCANCHNIVTYERNQNNKTK